MSSNEQLEQTLWELAYQLLPPEEEAALLQNITSDPAVARAYAKVQLQVDLAAAAAKCDDTRGRVVPPDDAISTLNDDAGTDFTLAKKPAADASRKRSGARRVANWIVAVAAMGLLVMSAFALTQLRSPTTRQLAALEEDAGEQEADFEFGRTAARNQPGPATANSASANSMFASPAEAGPATTGPVWTTVTAAPVWNEDTTNFISVRTSSLDGTPAATSFELKLYDEAGVVQLREMHRTDQNGAAQVEFTRAQAGNTSRLEVAANAPLSPPVATSGRWIRSGHLTHLTTDLPSYKPGETVSYRSLSLSRLDHRVTGEVAVEFNVLDDQGNPVPGAQHVVTSERGVGAGKFKIPADATYDALTIFARSPEGVFPEQRRHVDVRDVEAPRWKKELKLTRESYEPGDRVKGRLSVSSHDGQPAAGKKLILSAVADRQPIPLDTKTGITDADGNFELDFLLPPTVTLGEAAVQVQVADDQQVEQLVTPIPIHAGQVTVQFFAEGGELAAGLQNDVYFQAFDAQGEPVHLEGRVVDHSDREVAQATTVHGGRGRFALTTEAEAAYRLIVDKPASTQQTFPLPVVSNDAAVVLHTVSNVLGPTDDIEVTLRMRQPDRSLVLAAACRDRLVGLQAIERSDFSDAADGTSECRRSLQLAAEAGGVIRLTVYDSTHAPPTPVAERLVYRRPTRRLDVKIESTDAPQPGEKLAFRLQTTDESGTPTAAVLGVSVVNQAILNAVQDQAPNLVTHVFLMSEIQGANELEDANFYLGPGADAATAMDLLLGTRGWRRFEEIGPSQLARANTARLKSSMLAMGDTAQRQSLEKYDFDDDDRLAREGEDPLVPIVLDNRETIENERLALATAPITSSPALGYAQADRQADAPRPTQRSRRAQAPAPSRWGALLLLGGLLVLAAIAGLALTRSLERPRMWVPSLAMAGIAAVLGVFWLGSQVNQPTDLAYAPSSDAIAPPQSEAIDQPAMTVEGESAMFFDDAGLAPPSAEELEAARKLDDMRLGGAVGRSDVAPAEQTASKEQAHFQLVPPRPDGRAPSGGGFGGGVPEAASDSRQPAGRGGADAPSVQRMQRPDTAKGPKRESFKQFQAPQRTLTQPANSTNTPPDSMRIKDAAAPKQAAPKQAAPKQAARNEAAAPRAAPAATISAPRPSDPAPASESTPKPVPNAAATPPSPSPAPTLNKGTMPKSGLPATETIARDREDLKRWSQSTVRYRRVFAEQSDLIADIPSLPSTLAWLPLVITDAEGRATIPVQLPAADATYLLRADAHGDGRIGSGEAIITVGQP